MNRDTETKEYRFNEAKHLHEILVENEWKALTGCTTVLSVLAKPALIQWSANEAVKYAIEHAVDKGVEDGIPYYYINADTLEEAKTAHRKKKEKAGEAGTDVHNEVQKLVMGQIERNNGMFSGNEVHENPQVQHFINWAVQNKVKFLETEKGVYSRSYFIGGILDLIVEMDGELWIADIKTGSGIYPEHFAQMAGYEIMMSEMGYPPLKGSIVLNLKKTGEFEEKRSVSNEDAKELFLACLKIYRLQEKFKNQII